VTAVHLVIVSLRRTETSPPGDRDAAEVTDIVWAHATAADRLEHVRGHAHVDRVELLLFLRQDPQDVPDHARRLAVTLLGRCHAASAHLRARYHVPELSPAQPPRLPPAAPPGSQGPPPTG
jgi:hypothetical protein